MSETVTLIVDGIEFQVAMNDSPVAEAFLMQLPTTVRMSRWGEEYYGAVGLGMDNDADASDVVEVGAVAYWPPGDALCIFFGPTPVSHGDEPRAASAVTVIGQIEGDPVTELSGLGGAVSVQAQRSG